MRKAITSTLIFFVWLLIPFAVFCQDAYRLEFKIQPFVPAENQKKIQDLPLFNGRRYGLIQFYQIPDEATKKRLAAAGIELLDYIPQNAWTFSAPLGHDPYQVVTNIRALVELRPIQKLDEALAAGTYPQWAKNEPGKVDLVLQTFRKEDVELSQIRERLGQLGAKTLEAAPLFQTITLRVSIDQISILAAEPWVQWMEPILPPAQKENLPGKNLHRSQVLEYGIRNLTGSGVKVAIWDGGEVGKHQDFSGRLSLEETSAPDNHATHVMGTIGSAGILDPFARGMAPAASLFSYNFSGSVPGEMTAAIPAKGLIVTSHSYGFGDAFVNCTNGDPYNSNSRSQDLVLVNFPNVMHVHSSGNSQAVCTGGWKTTTGKAAKNMLVVANGTVNEAMSGSSSFGPVQDGRLKPEITGMGTGVFSTTPNNTYMTMSGTSMATPGVSGTITQLYQRYRQLNAGADPRSALMKALVCNTAKDRGNAGPDYKFGFGTINGLKAVRAMEANRYEVNSISNGANFTKTISIPANTAQVRVMIAWLDPAGAANANPALINNLNLTLTDPSSTVYNPWVLDPANPGNVATRGVDSRNNIEQVTLANPPAGDYIITVNGASIPSGPQEYALTWEFDNNGIEIIYPNGGEILQPGTNAGLIFWDSYGVTANQTVEYSTNNGTNWTSLGTVASTVNAVAWTVPASISNQYLMRVTQGALTDQSDATFSVIGTPTNLNFSQGCNAGEMLISWNAVTGATQYDVLKLDTVTNNWNVVGADVAGTNFLATGLSTAQRHWFSVRAKANALSVVGQRCPAVVTTGQHVTPFAVTVLADATSGCAPLNTTLRAIVPATAYTSSSITFGTLSGTPTNITSWTGNADDGFASVAIPFPFKFYNADFTSLFVSTNGFVTFGAGSAANAPNAFPNTAAPNHVIALCFADLNLTSSGTCGYFTTGTAPNRRLVIQYNNVPPFSGTGTLSGQIILHEGSNLIELQISNQNLSGNKTQGVENASGTAGTVVAGRSNANWTATNDGRRFTPTLPATYSWSPGTNLSSTSVQYPTANPSATVTYNLTVTYNGCTVNGSVTLTVTNVPGQPGLISGPTSVCSGSGYTYSIAPVSGATGYTWTLPGAWAGSSSTTSLSATPDATSGNVQVVATNSCGAGPARNLTVSTFSSVPAQPALISGNQDICANSNNTYSITALSDVENYAWSFPAGFSPSSSSGASLTSVSTTAGTASGFVTVLATNACGNGVAQNLSVSVTNKPVQPDIISGTTPVCNATNHTYSIDPVPEATSYVWTLPSGWSGTSVSESILATASANSGTISVRAENICGQSPVRTLAVTAVSIPGQPGGISGPATVCEGTTHNYSVASVSGATGYVWTLPAGWSGTSVTTTLAATAGTSGGLLSVAAENFCGVGPTRDVSLNVTLEPSQPGPVSGNTDICNGSLEAYSVDPVPGATSYTWILPSGWSGTSATPNINTTASANSGNIQVRANNSCGNSGFESLAVAVTSIPAQPGLISGSTPVCLGTSQSYSISPVAGASSYNWNLPVGWSGTSNSENINATVGSLGGIISITAENQCGISAPRNFAVSVSEIPSQPGPIAGSDAVCAGSNQNYFISPVAGANSYEWSLPGDWMGSSNTFGMAAVAGNNPGFVSVSAVNFCGTSPAQTLSISILTIPAQPGPISGSTTVISGISSAYSVSSVPGATDYIWNLPPGWTGSSTTTGISVLPNVISGSLEVAAHNTCGTSPLQSLFITATDPGTGLEVNNWLGLFNVPSGNNWQNPANWSIGLVPTASHLARILSSTNYAPQIAGSVLAGAISLENGAAIQFTDPTARLQVSGNWKGNPGQVAGPGNVELVGNQAQLIQGTTTFQNFFVQKSGGQVQISGTVRVKGIMQFMNANANLVVLPGANLIFHSDQTRTGKLGPVPAGMTISGDVTSERALNYPSGSLGNWFFMGSPIQGNNFSDWADDLYMAAPGGAYCGVQPGVQTISNVEHTTIFKYVEALHNLKTDNVQKIGWRIPGNENIIPGMGYRVWVKRYNNPTGKFTNSGPVTYGPFTFPTLTRNHFSPCYPSLPTHPQDECNEAQRGWNLLANPYPCDINWDGAGWSKPVDMGNAFYTWNNLGSGYGFYSGGSYLGVTPAPQNPHIIPSGQGFFVRLNTPGTQVLQVNESAKITSASGQFLKIANQQANQFKIHLGKQTQVPESQGFEIAVRFRPDATDLIDAGKDFASLGSNRFHFSIPVENEKLLLSTYEPLSEPKTIPLLMEYAGESGTFSMQFSGLESFESGLDLWVKDKVQQTLTPVNTQNPFVFQVGNANHLNDSDRFELLIAPALVGNQMTRDGAGWMVYPNPTTGRLQVYLPVTQEHVQATCVNELGQVFPLGETTLSGNDWALNLGNLPAGVYQLRIQGQTQSWKRKLVKY